MKYLYTAVLLLIFVLAFFSRKYKKEFFKRLNREDNPLLIMYPFSAKIIDLLGKFLPGNKTDKIDHYMKSLYVKENIRDEKYIYKIKKTAVIILIITACSFLGLVTCLLEKEAQTVDSLTRNEFGEGSANYDLDVGFKGLEEPINITIDELELKDEEIYELFDESYDDIVKEMLGENESQENVSEPLNLISEYGNIDIYWEIDDLEAVNYNGEIKEEQKEGDTKLVNLYAVFSIGDVQEKYNIPIIITAKTLTEREQIITEIKQLIEEKNDKYSKDVSLPVTVNGERVYFKTITNNNESLFMILGLFAAAIIFFMYDRTLENKVKKRKEEMMLDFSEIVSKLSLLYNAGLSIYGAWERIVDDYEKSIDKNEKERIGKKKKRSAEYKERFAYKEMKLVIEKIKSGMSEGTAYEQFGKRCALHPYIKLGNILEQNLTKGTKGMKQLLKQEVDDSLEIRKRSARKKGEEASTKMLIPMMIMLVIVIVIVSVPALMSMKF